MSASFVTEIVTNLVSNAIKYSQAGETVTVGGSLDGETVGLRVADTGLGIPEKALSTIFERFKRVELPDRSQVPGTGIGLFIVDRVVRRLEGAIVVESELGVGSTFTVRLPAASVLAAGSPIPFPRGRDLDNERGPRAGKPLIRLSCVVFQSAANHANHPESLRSG